MTGVRIANARSEPNNWLTYYGSYDGNATVRSRRSTPVRQVHGGPTRTHIATPETRRPLEEAWKPDRTERVTRRRRDT
jgi:hypothetical protein